MRLVGLWKNLVYETRSASLRNTIVYVRETRGCVVVRDLSLSLALRGTDVESRFIT